MEAIAKHDLTGWKAHAPWCQRLHHRLQFGNLFATPADRLTDFLLLNQLLRCWPFTDVLFSSEDSEARVSAILTFWRGSELDLVRNDHTARTWGESSWSLCRQKTVWMRFCPFQSLDSKKSREQGNRETQLIWENASTWYTVLYNSNVHLVRSIKFFVHLWCGFSFQCFFCVCVWPFRLYNFHPSEVDSSWRLVASIFFIEKHHWYKNIFDVLLPGEVAEHLA